MNFAYEIYTATDQGNMLARVTELTGKGGGREWLFSLDKKTCEVREVGRSGVLDVLEEPGAFLTWVMGHMERDHP